MPDRRDGAVVAAVVFAGVTRCQRCGGGRLRRSGAHGRFAVVGCGDCQYQHVRDLRAVRRAVRSAEKAAAG